MPASFLMSPGSEVGVGSQESGAESVILSEAKDLSKAKEILRSSSLCSESLRMTLLETPDSRL
jgi:hypothetical protein